MRDRKKRNIIIGSLCCLLVFMGIGYAILSQVLNINGTATLTGKWEIYIESITEVRYDNTTTGKSNSASVSSDKLTADFDVELLKPGDYVEYDVVVKNNGSINAVLRELIPTINSGNMDTLLTHSIIQGQILKAGATTSFRLKIRFDERATELPTTEEERKTSYQIKLVYEQYDGDTSGIVDGVVPVTANDCFTIDDAGVITGYDYSCGTYVTVPAVVNGTTVTEIGSSAFTEGNTVIYMSEDGESGFYVALTQQAYNDLYILLGPDGEGMTTEQLSQMLFMEGDLNIPDTTNMIKQIMYIDLNNEYIGAGIADIEYLDLSQATGLKKIGDGAFVSNPSDTVLKYLNLDEVNIESLGEQALQFANLDSLTITTDMHSLFHKKIATTIDTLRIYPGTTTEIADQSCNYEEENNITVNKLIIGEGITKIGQCAFKGNENKEYSPWIISSVELPESLIEIGEQAFYWSTMTSIKLPSRLKSIGKSAFGMTQLNSLYIPSSVEMIGDYAFSGSRNLTNLRFEEGSKLTYIGKGAFSSSSQLTTLDFSPIKQKFEIGDAAFHESSVTTLKIKDAKIGHCALPSALDSLELIGDIELYENESNSGSISCTNTFEDGLIELIIKSDTLENIPDSAFAFAFQSETRIEFLNEAGTEVNSSIKTIGTSAFSRATPTTLILPNSLEKLGQHAFYYANPTTLVMSPVIKTIEQGAFRSLTIESLTIPSTIENIGYVAFDSMPSTSTITVNKAEGSFTTVSGWNGKAKVIYNP